MSDDTGTAPRERLARIVCDARLDATLRGEIRRALARRDTPVQTLRDLLAKASSS